MAEIGFDGSTQTTSAETGVLKPNPEVIHSMYYDGLIREAEKKAPDKVDVIAKMAEAVDVLSVDNTGLFQSEKYPGVAAPFTQVSSRQFAQRVFGDIPVGKSSESALENRPPRRHHIFSSGYEGVVYPQSSESWLYRNVINGVPAVIRRTIDEGNTDADVVSHVFSRPASALGSVTPAFRDAVRQNGIAADSDVMAEYVKKLLSDPQNKDAKVTLEGLSMGSGIVLGVRELLPPEMRDKVEYLVTNPGGLNIPRFQFRDTMINSAAIRLLAFGLEGGIRGFGGDANHKDALSKRNPVLERIKARLASKKGIRISEDPEQEKLKKETVNLELKAVARGRTAEVPEERTYARKGVYDPISVNVPDVVNHGLGKRFFGGKKGQFGIKFSGFHTVNWRDVGKMAQVYDSAKDLIQKAKATKPS